MLKKIFSYIVYGIVYAFWYTMSLLPLRLLYVFSDFLYLLIGVIVRYRHRVIWENLESSFPEKNKEELLKIEKDFYHYFADYLVETIKLMTMSPEELQKRMVFTGIEDVEKAVDQGLSCGCYLGHYGNWEWITSLPYWIPEKSLCCEFYHPLENALFDNLIKKVRERQGALCIPMQESLRRIVQFRQQGKPLVIGYIADQAPHWKNIHHWVDFLNHDTPVLTGTERIIKKTRQAAFYMDVKRVKRGYFTCEFRLIAMDTKGISDFELTDIYFRELEKTIRRNPGCYLWSHNRWKRTREEFNERFEVIDGKVYEKE